MTSVDAYKEAYQCHYKEKNLEKAFSQYYQIQVDFPNTPEAKYAGQQIKNIKINRLDKSKIASIAIEKYNQLMAIEEEKELKARKEEERQQYITEQEIKRRNELIVAKQKTIALFSDYSSTYSIANKISFNKEKKVFAIKTSGEYSKVHEFSELIDYEVYEDGRSVVTSNAGPAAIGAMLFGVKGAIIGAAAASQTQNEYVSDLHIRLIYDNIENVMEKIPIILTPVKKHSNDYKEYLHICESILSALQYVLHHNKKDDKKTITVFSVADEIKKFKDLLDNGIISESEYAEQKSKLLKIDYNKIYFNE